MAEYCQKSGLPADKMDVTGKAHNPENEHVVPEFMDILKSNPSLFQLPDHCRLQVTVRSNRDGEPLTDATIMEDMIIMMLAACCDWFGLLSKVAADLKATGRQNHRLVIFGLNDSVPLSPYNRQRLKISKFKANQLLISDPYPRTTTSPQGPQGFPDDAIAVVGVACRFPGADNLEELWELVAKGHDAHQEIPRDRIDPTRSFRASQDPHMAKRRYFGNFLQDIKRFDNAFFGMNNKEAASLDPQQRMLLELSYEALECSGYLPGHARSAEDPVACFIGGSLGEYAENTSSHPTSAYAATGTIRAFMCGRVSYNYGWTGPSEVIDTACSSSLVAIHRACRAIQTGDCEMAVAGGVSALTTMGNFLDLGKAGFLSQTGQCKPFDASADGYCRSEGGGLVVLKKLREAVRAGDKVFGVIPSINTNQGGTSTTLTVPSASALKSLYRSLFTHSGLKPSQISYVETHGTGTQAGDPIEMDSVREVMGDASRTTPVSIGSIKGNIGHCEAAAGVAGLLKVLAMIKYGGIPPQANHRRLNPKIPALELDGMEISKQLKNWDVPQRAALVNSYGAGGSNCALLCCEMLQTKTSKPAMYQTVGNSSFPVIISAATRASLVLQAQDLAKYLSKNQTRLTMAGVAFTLNQRRKRHRFCFDASSADLPGLICALQQVKGPSFEYPTQPKPVVLVVSGQYDDKVALDRKLYEAYPAFRGYIDACDSELTRLGFPSIQAAIFQKTSLATALELQCSIFATEYACARCWLDGGLKPNAILGHSLGEIVSLAVSGAVSLSDCLKLVATRAQLIDNKWGSERGVMLAIHTDLTRVHNFIAHLSRTQKESELEIACYNSPTSTIVAGSSAAVDVAERLLSTDKAYAGIKYQRLSTTHAFHSKFAEPIMTDLDRLFLDLTWNEPLIPLEVCTPKGVKSIREWSAARHARDPVYFGDAVQRVEQKFGSCNWIEVGLGSPVIPMTKRAMKDGNAQTFHPVNVNGEPATCIARTISGFWRSGLSATHWYFLGEGRDEVTEAWLPPYYFERNQHWVDNIDRAMEEHEKALAAASSAATRQPSAPAAATVPTQLVFRKSSSAQGPNTAVFSINTMCERFQKVVRGHAVLRQPLCPAPLYLESVTNALQLLVGDKAARENLSYEDLQFQSPLGLDPSRQVEILLEQLVAEHCWKFAVRSVSSGSNSNAASAVHCLGTVSLSQKANLATYGRLVEGSTHRLNASESVERFKSQRAYEMFTKVMHYAPFFKGIRSMAVDNDEATASVKLPENQPGRSDSPAWMRCDAVLIDAFISVVGLLLNSSEAAAEGEIMIAVGIERVVLTNACQPESQGTWSVYTKFTDASSDKPTGDVFVCSPEKKVVAMMLGVQFSKLGMTKLTKFLGAANASSPSAAPVKVSVVKTPAPVALTTSAPVPAPMQKAMPIAEPSGAKVNSGGASIESAATRIKQIISNYTGLSPGDIPGDSVLVDLGIDSLSLIEFTEELSKAFELEPPDGLGNMVLDELISLVAKSSKNGEASSDSPSDETFNTQQPSSPATPSVFPMANPAATPSSTDSSASKIKEVISNYTGLNPEDIPGDSPLVDLGIDSLSLIEFSEELNAAFGAEVPSDNMGQMTVNDLTLQLGGSVVAPSTLANNGSQPNSEPDPGSSLVNGANGVNGVNGVNGANGAMRNKPGSPDSLTETSGFETTDEVLNGTANPLKALLETDSHFQEAANRRGYVDYEAKVLPLQDLLVQAYTLEAFKALGVDVLSFSAGSVLPRVHHIAKHDKLVARLWEILQSHGVIFQQGSILVRGRQTPQFGSAAAVYERFASQFPAYLPEAKLMKLCGEKLADCLKGEQDPLLLMFGSTASSKIMADYYGNSPMVSTLTDQLVTLVMNLVRGRGAQADQGQPVRILEVGAGTGGTTFRLAQNIEAAGIPCSYTFTDISPRFVTKAKDKLKQFSWIKYDTFDLEKEAPPTLRSQFDIVIGTNCVHATSSRVASCRRLRDCLVDDGVAILSEGTKPLAWFDLTFGLLEGWWVAENGTEYPLQPASKWMEILKEAGFLSSGFTQGPCGEAFLQQLLVGCKKDWAAASSWAAPTPSTTSDDYRLETVVYKEVSGVQIHADLYLPRVNQQTSPRAIGMTIIPPACVPSNQY